MITISSRVFLFLLCSSATLLGQGVQLVPVADGFESPVYVTHAGDGSRRLFVVEQPGRIRIVRGNGQVVGAPFLDITALVRDGGERGLLGLAFHPGYASNGRFFVNYTRTSGGQLETVIEEYQVDPIDPDRSQPQGRVLLTYDQPFTNHNGGSIAFGPDGFLYIASGDGGAGGDPLGHGQRLNSLLGKILRIDVDSGDPFVVPPDNPFVARPGARPEIYAYGLRNPWRLSFDRSTGRLFTADVGQNTWEEVDLIESGGNYGWVVMEGPDCFPPAGSQNCDRDGLILPIDAYGRTLGQSVTGGYVYRGSRRTPFWGRYFFGDFVSGNLFVLAEVAPGQWERTLLMDTGRNISSFGEDEQGELYLVDYGGEVLRLELAEAPEVRAYAQLALGGGFRDIVLASNRSDEAWEGTVQLRQGDGEVWDTPWSLNGADRSGESELSLQLPAHGTMRLELGGDETAREGYLLISAGEGSNLADVAVSFFYNFLDGTGLVDSTASLPAEAASLYRFPVESSAGVDTGVAWAAFPGLRPNSVRLRLYDGDGTLVGGEVRPFDGHEAFFFSERFVLGDDFAGLLELEADLPLAVTVLRQELTADGFQLTTIPAEK